MLYKTKNNVIKIFGDSLMVSKAKNEAFQGEALKILTSK